MVFYFLAAPLLRSCRTMAFGSPPQRDHTPLTPLVPSPQPSGLCSVINSRGARGPPRGRQARGLCQLFTVPSFWESHPQGSWGLRQGRWWTQGKTLKVRQDGLQGPWPLDNRARGPAWARLLALHVGSWCFPDFGLCLTPSQWLTHLCTIRTVCSFSSFCILTQISLNKCI